MRYKLTISKGIQALRKMHECSEYKHVIHKVLLNQAETWDLIFCFSACTWINISSSNNKQRNYERLKITVFMCNGSKIMDTKMQKNKKPNCHF